MADNENLDPEMDEAGGAMPGVEVDIEDEDESEVIENADGSADIVAEQEEEADEEAVEAHFENLAESLPETKLSELARTLLDLVERDKEARQRRDDRYAEGLRRSGIAGDGQGGADFEGASRVVHPVVNEAAIDFAAKAIKELFPPNGPVRDKIIGQPSPIKVEKARRKARWMNYQITEQMTEFRSDLEQALSQTALTGAQYLKFYWDRRLERPKCEPVFADNALYPAAASSWGSAERRTHRQYLTTQEFKRRIDSGMYVDVDAITGMDPERSEAQTATDDIQGNEHDPENIDGLRVVYEISLCIDAEEEGRVDPYLVTVDETTNKVLSVYRNWEPDDDERRQELPWIVEFPFIPWRDGPIGLTGLIGSIEVAATGALRALLDSAHINNMPAGLKLKGGPNAQTVRPSPGEFIEIDGGAVGQDIRQLVMGLPYNPPSPVLFQLLGFLVQTGKGVVQTTLDNLSEQNPNAPVGTTLALIEQGMTVFSAIHARLHASMGQCLKILHRLNKHHLSSDEVQDETGEIIASRADFSGPMDIIPVSDPNVFSEAQRLAQIQAVLQRSANNPVYNQREVEAEFLDRIKLGELKDRLLNPVPQPEHLNAANENVAATLGRPVLAFPEQDHLAHLIAHMEFIKSPVFGMNTLIGAKATPVLLNHVREHFALWYLQQVYLATADMAGVPPEALIDNKDEEVVKEFDKLMAQVSSAVIAGAQDVLNQFLPDLQAAQQFAQQFQPPQPQDPTAVAAQQVQARAQADQQNAQIKSQQIQLQAQNDAQRNQLQAQALQLKQADQQLRAQEAQQRNQTQMDVAALNNTTRKQMNDSDNTVAMEIAAAEIASGNRTNLSTGTGINPSP